MEVLVQGEFVPINGRYPPARAGTVVSVCLASEADTSLTFGIQYRSAYVKGSPT